MKALFVDRDGVINKLKVGGYITAPSEFIVLPDVFPLLTHAHQHGYLIIVASNQQGVGKGLMTDADLQAVHTFMQDELRSALGFGVDAAYYCTDLAGTGSVRRKPAPGMLLDAIREHQLQPDYCWFVGDSVTDAAAGHAAGVHTALVGPHNPTDATIVAPNLNLLTSALIPHLR